MNQRGQKPDTKNVQDVACCLRGDGLPPQRNSLLYSV